MEKLYHHWEGCAQHPPGADSRRERTGKELVARYSTLLELFKDKPFLPVDCGSLVRP